MVEIREPNQKNFQQGQRPEVVSTVTDRTGIGALQARLD